jgi:hypothetical protein
VKRRGVRRERRVGEEEGCEEREEGRWRGGV